MKHTLNHYGANNLCLTYLGLTIEKQEQAEAMVLLSNELFEARPKDSKYARVNKVLICTIIIEEYYHCLDPKLRISSYQAKL